MSQVTPAQAATDPASQQMSMQDALSLLNDSPWARTQTATRVVSGVGSGEYGEKEIFERFYIRLLSAPSIQAAYARVWRLLSPESSLEAAFGALEADYLVIGLAFRSNQPDRESQIRNTLQSQTVETLRNRVYLSTKRFPQLQSTAYFPPTESAVGAQFVFPVWVAGQKVLDPDDETFAFELDLPGERERLRVTFPVSEEVIPAEQPSPGEFLGEESISEFKVQDVSGTGVDLDSNRFGGVVNVFPAQKTGRVFHGSIYEYHRNDNLDARNFFDPVGQSLPEFKRNQFGGSLSVELGPRLSFFGSYDGLRISKGSTLISNVPTAAMKSGDFSELLLLQSPVQLMDPLTGQPFAGNQIPTDRIHLVAQNLLPVFPAPNRNETVRNFVNSQPVVEDADTWTFRADLGQEQSHWSINYAMIREERLDVRPFPEFGARANDRRYEASVSYTRKFGDNTVANLRLEFDRSQELATARQDRAVGLLDSLGILGVEVDGSEDEGYPAFEVDGYPNFGDEDLPEHEVENRFGLEGELSLARGNHLFSLSGEIDWDQLNDSRSNSLLRGEFSFSGAYSGHAFADFLLGRAVRAHRAVGSSRQDLRSHGFELRFVDEWRVHSQLTVNLGLGYEYAAPYRSIRSNLSVFRPFLFEPPLEGQLIDLGNDPSISTVVGSDWNNFRPSLGLAYRPFGDSRFVVRAFYSIFYESLPNWLFENFMGRNYPYYFLQGAQAAVDSTGLDLGAPFDGETATELTIRDIDPNFRTPYRQVWNLRLQQVFKDNWSLELRYRGRRNVGDRRFLPANVPLPAPGPIQARRPNPEFGSFTLATGAGSALLHQFGVEPNRRFADSFTFNASFELSKRFDDDFSDDPSNPRNLAAEWALNDEPVNRLFLNFIVDLPLGKGRRWGHLRGLDPVVGGWRLSGIARLRSGEPFSVVLPGDPNNDGLSEDRPDRINSGHLTSGKGSIDRWFDTDAFVAPAPFTFGDAGRNILYGPGFQQWDLSLIKDFLLKPDHRLQLRFAFFNAFNKANFDNPGNLLGTQSFGVISGAGNAREIEIALKYSF